jgi:hypothetical protein
MPRCSVCRKEGHNIRTCPQAKNKTVTRAVTPPRRRAPSPPPPQLKKRAVTPPPKKRAVSPPVKRKRAASPPPVASSSKSKGKQAVKPLDHDECFELYKRAMNMGHVRDVILADFVEHSKRKNVKLLPTFWNQRFDPGYPHHTGKEDVAAKTFTATVKQWKAKPDWIVFTTAYGSGNFGTHYNALIIDVKARTVYQLDPGIGQPGNPHDVTYGGGSNILELLKKVFNTPFLKQFIFGNQPVTWQNVYSKKPTQRNNGDTYCGTHSMIFLQDFLANKSPTDVMEIVNKETRTDRKAEAQAATWMRKYKVLKDEMKVQDRGVEAMTYILNRTP